MVLESLTRDSKVGLNILFDITSIAGWYKKEIQATLNKAQYEM
jgi:hypothetical protein